MILWGQPVEVGTPEDTYVNARVRKAGLVSDYTEVSGAGPSGGGGGFTCLNEKVMFASRFWTSSDSSKYVSAGTVYYDNPAAALCEADSGAATTARDADLTVHGCGAASEFYDYGWSNLPAPGGVFRRMWGLEALSMSTALLIHGPWAEAFTDPVAPDLAASYAANGVPFEWVDGIDHRVIHDFNLVITAITDTSNPNGAEPTGVKIFRTTTGGGLVHVAEVAGFMQPVYDNKAAPSDLAGLDIQYDLGTISTVGETVTYTIPLDWDTWLTDTAPGDWVSTSTSVEGPSPHPDRYGVFIIATDANASGTTLQNFPPEGVVFTPGIARHGLANINVSVNLGWTYPSYRIGTVVPDDPNATQCVVFTYDGCTPVAPTTVSGITVDQHVVADALLIDVGQFSVTAGTPRIRCGTAGPVTATLKDVKVRLI